MSPIETNIVNQLLDAATRQAWSLSIWDGEAFALDRLKLRNDIEQRDEVLAMLASTDTDVLTFYLERERLGWVLLVWGNDQDLISDYTTNAESDSPMDKLVASVVIVEHTVQ